MNARHLAFALIVAACGGSATIDGTSGEDGGAGGTSGDGGSAGAGNRGGGGSAGGVSTGGSAGSAGAAGAPAVSCNPIDVACNGNPPQCPVGEVPSVVQACWGPCVPILSCAAEPNCDNCPIGFCVEYVSRALEYRCALVSPMCSALACECLEPYLCPAPFDACHDSMAADIACECVTC